MFSLALTTFDRFDTFTEKHIDKYLENEYLSEIVVTDDCSPDYVKLLNKYGSNPKVKIFTNQENMDCYRNKLITANHTSCDWICLMDSDNFCDLNYFQALLKFWEINGRDENTVYMPSKALPVFDYTQLNNMIIDKSNWNLYYEGACFNTFNLVFHRSVLKYQDDTSFDPAGVDSLYMNMKWVKNGVKLAVVPDMEYQHGMHACSHHLLNDEKTARVRQTIDFFIRDDT